MNFRIFCFLKGPGGIVEAPLKDLTTTNELKITADNVSDALERFVPSLRAFETKLVKSVSLIGFKMELIE